MKKHIQKLLLVLVIISVLNYAFPYYTNNALGSSAQSLSDLQSQLNVLLNQESQIQSSIKSEKSKSGNLAGQINNLSTKIQTDQNIIAQKEQLISDTQQQIGILKKSIAGYVQQISDLNDKTNHQVDLMNNRAKASYENTFVSPLQLVFDNKNINDAVLSFEYFDNSRKADIGLVHSLNNTLTTLNSDKTTLDTQQSQLNTSLTDLTNQQNQLQADRINLQSEQNQLLSQKQKVDSSLSSDSGVLNKLQGQAANIQSQMAYIQSLTSGKSYAYPQCGNFGGHSDSSWYANQLCSGYRIVRFYGCLATSLSMVNAYYTGNFINPYNYMDPYSGMLTGFPVINGKYPTQLGIFGEYGLSFGSYKGMVDRMLSNGSPVIVGMWPVEGGTHFIVLIKPLPNGDYLINNPAGNHPDETLWSDGFNTNLVHEIIYYQ